MSPWTNRLQRSTRSVAPFSGLNVRFWACASGVHSAVPVPSVAAATAPADPSRNLRRLTSVIGVSFSNGDGVQEKRTLVCGLGGQASTGARIEEVGALDVGLQMNEAAGGEVVALAEHDREICPLVAAGDEDVGAGGLED